MDIFTKNFMHRFDIMAKILYVKYREVEWYTNLYINNIRTFNGGWEYPGTKINIDEYIVAFDKLIKSFGDNGFLDNSEIPIGTNNIMVNGAHRLVLSYILNIKPKIKHINKKGCNSYTHAFFKNRPRIKNSDDLYFKHRSEPENRYYGIKGKPQILKGMEQKYMDRMALEFCLNVKTFKIICLFPRAKGNDNAVEKILQKNGYIYYRKRIKITKQALIKFTHEIYRGEKWIGGFFPSSSQKGELCWGDDDLRIFIYVPNNCNIANMKKSIRDIYKVQNHSVHIHDTYDEGIRVAKTVLNKNSIDFLEKSVFNLSKKNKNLFQEYYEKIKQLDSDDYCIDSSFVLALYGIREANDLDYLSLENKKLFNGGDIECHNSWAHHYTINKNDIILIPDNHFYYAGLKVASLDIVKKMKEKRNEIKDQTDVALINKYLGI